MGITEILLERGLITSEQLAAAMDLRKKDGIRADRALIRLGFVTEEELLKVTSETLSIPMVNLAEESIEVETLRSLPAKLVFKKHLVPVRQHDGTLTVATSDPFDLYALDELHLHTGLEIQTVLAPEEEIDKVIKAHYGVGGDTLDELIAEDDLDISASVGTEDEIEQAQEASVIKLVNEILIEAVNERASDIHIEPYENDLKVRYRIDGVLQEAGVPAAVRRFQSAIISRIKIMADLNIAEKRKPQDGRIKFRTGGKEIDVRVSIIPMLFGEGIVMRLLDKANVLFTLPELGMAADTHGVFKELIARPHGIILVTGPTGSGKTTTLYAALSAIVNGQIKVLTVEDPVEYHLDGVNQIQVYPKVGLTFAAGLRAILRHDPDVVMIGEIRDFETAEAAIQASLTGHLVLSTLHTNDACSAATRLVDMGVEPFLVTSTLNAAMAQRLVRKICTECRVLYEPDRTKLPDDFHLEPDAKLYRGEGCRRCRGTGFRGRSGLYELMVNNDEISQKIMDRAPSFEVVHAAKRHGLRLLREDGWNKVRAGITTPEEVVRSTKL
ncbi:MAG: type II secretion system ATPase GspE [Phycisphaeraceae bacterium]|nr:type II secretion system ATPase GspE [Phycisphaeraceae bacterium]